MSGIFGVLDSQHRLPVEGLLTEMGRAMSHREWYVVETWADRAQNVAFGRLGIGIFNRTPQPAWNAAHTVALVMAGEFYSPRPAGAQTDEQAALAWYEQHGPDFARHLKGAFLLAIWDAAQRRLVITNDRYGLYPLYYAQRAGCFIFAPEVKGVLCDRELPRELDLTALAQYLRFQHLLGERTFFEDVRQLSPATVLEVDTSTAVARLTRYWSWAQVPHRADVRFEEAAEETGRLLRAAVRRASGDAYRPGVYLSGGLDSRTLLGLVERRPVVSLTYGQRDCRDVHYAARIARAVGSEHHWFDLPDGQWVKEQADFHLTLTEGFHSWIHAHGMSTLPQARQLIDVNLTGWDGGTVMGHRDSIEPLQTAAVDDTALTLRLYQLFTEKYTWPSLTEAEEALAYAPALAARMRGLAFDSFRAELTPFLAYHPEIRGECFYVRQHSGRLTHNLITFYRSHVEMRFPFFDYDLLDFMYALPASVRGHRRLYRAVIQQETPRLAYIPYDHDELLPTTHRAVWTVHAAGVKLWNRFNRNVWPLFPRRPTLYADYENYLRHELREWAEGILFDRRTVERGLFDPAFVRTLMKRHLSGQEQWTIGKIAPLITYEMMLRALVDA